MSRTEMAAFRSLSLRERWIVMSCIRRGRAPNNPQLAPATVELAEHYRYRGIARIVPWLGLIAVCVISLIGINHALAGNWNRALVDGLLIAARLAFVPWMPLVWSGNVRRSLEATRRLRGEDVGTR
jgi:hypothetical protein